MPFHSKRLITILLFCYLCVTCVASAAANDWALIRIPMKGPAMMRDLQDRGIDVLALNRDGTIDVMAHGKHIDYVLSLGLPASIVQTPDMVSSFADLDENLGLYHTYEEMEAVLNNLALTYPLITQLTVIGTSIEGRNIYMLKISDNPTVDESEGEVLYMGCHHARELMTVEIPLKLAIYLLENYGIDSKITDLVDEREIFVAPMINPDGHVYVQDNHSGNPSNWWRKNRRINPDMTFGVDLNRNYGYKWGFDDFGSSPATTSPVYRGTGPFSEPESQTVRDFCEARDISLAFSYHSYGELLLYGWGYKFGYTPDHDVFFALGEVLTASNGYSAGNPAMGAIYLTNGDIDDWAYGEQTTKNSFFGFTPEVNSFSQGGFGPPETLIQPTFDLLLPMNMLLLQLADNPYQVVGPYRPTLFPIDTSWLPNYELQWSDNDPNDPNPIVSYEVIEYKNISTIPQDPADSVSPDWDYNGFSVSTARKFEGSGSYYSGAVHNTSSRLEMKTFYRVTSITDEFTAKLWYNIESGWDYAYLQVSNDGGLTWKNVAGNVTTMANPNGSNRGNGITGTSGGWVDASFPLGAFVGQDLLIRFNYLTDAAILGEGLYVDLPGPVATHESKQVIADNITDATSLLITPTTTGDFSYQVRAHDADDDLSLWSSSETISVTSVTGVRDVKELATSLGTNYPNPFNPVTQIPYTVGTEHGSQTPRRVTLAIYDVTGRLIASLVDRDAPPGAYRAVWRATNDRGEAVASGVYFARLTVGSTTPPMRKLVFLK